jgi:hypothetical protein
LMRSESCEFNLGGKKTPRALMSRLRPKKWAPAFFARHLAVRGFSQILLHLKKN